MPKPITLIATIAAASAAAMVFGGCSDAPATGQREQAPGYRRAWSDDDVVKPDWLANPTRGGTVIAAWGSTPHDPFGGRGIMRDKALDSARRELARMVMVKVQSVLNDYLAESGGSGGAGLTTYTESISRSIAVQSIRASYQRDEWIHPKTGELFIWAVADPSFAKQLAQNVGSTASDNPSADAHTRARLESDQGFAELDRLLDRSFSQTGR